VRVVQGRGRTRLALEALARGVVVELAGGEELEGDVAGEPQVLGLVDDPHATLAQTGGDAIVGDSLADHGPSSGKGSRRRETRFSWRSPVGL
jgi:hypothetical protein